MAEAPYAGTRPPATDLRGDVIGRAEGHPEASGGIAANRKPSGLPASPGGSVHRLRSDLRAEPTRSRHGAAVGAGCRRQGSHRLKCVTQAGSTTPTGPVSLPSFAGAFEMLDSGSRSCHAAGIDLRPVTPAPQSCLCAAAEPWDRELCYGRAHGLRQLQQRDEGRR